MGKINKEVHYSEYLNLRPYMSESKVWCWLSTLLANIISSVFITNGENPDHFQVDLNR